MGRQMGRPPRGGLRHVSDVAVARVTGRIDPYP